MKKKLAMNSIPTITYIFQRIFTNKNKHDNHSKINAVVEKLEGQNKH
jgi:hypothetical protein